MGPRQRWCWCSPPTRCRAGELLTTTRTTTRRYCLNQAIQDKQTDTITFASSLAGQTITLSSSLLTAPSGFPNPYGGTAFIVGASDNITIDGSGAPLLTISGNNATRPFVVAGGGTLTLENLTVSGGFAGGGNGGNATFTGTGGGGGGGAGLGAGNGGAMEWR